MKHGARTWAQEEYQASGVRKVSSIEPWTPMHRWNTWQTLRGRPNLCIEPGDQLIRCNGDWAITETCHSNKQPH